MSVKRNVQLVTGAWAVLGAARDMRQFKESGSRLELVQAGLKLAVAVIGLVLAYRSADETPAADDASVVQENA